MKREKCDYSIYQENRNMFAEKLKDIRIGANRLKMILKIDFQLNEKNTVLLFSNLNDEIFVHMIEIRRTW